LFYQVSASTNPATLTTTSSAENGRNDNNNDTPKNDSLKNEAANNQLPKSQAVVKSVVRNEEKGTTEKTYSGQI
jgi:phospholipase C